MVRVVYVACVDFGYEGYGEPKGVYTSLELLMNEFPDAVPASDSQNPTAVRTVYFELELE